MSKTIEAVREDPTGAGLVLIAPALFIFAMAFWLLPTPKRIIPPIPQPAPARPNVDWLKQAGVDDVLTVPGYRIAYWGKPDAKYSEWANKAPKAFEGIVIHYTVDKPMARLMQYQHNGDKRRGGSYGYHVYVSKTGAIGQGAPMTKRTNHIKKRMKRQRTGVAKHLDNSNAIGVTQVGGCVVASRSKGYIKCAREETTERQRSAAMAAVRALQARYGLQCAAVWGHGELQTDRASFEGLRLAHAIRSGCRPKGSPL